MAKHTSGLKSMSEADLRREIARRERRSKSLLRRRARLAASLGAVEADIIALGVRARAPARGGRPGRTGPRYSNTSTLPDTLRKVMKSKTMSIGEALAAVQRAGYRSTARNF